MGLVFSWKQFTMKNITRFLAGLRAQIPQDRAGWKDLFLKVDNWMNNGSSFDQVKTWRWWTRSNMFDKYLSRFIFAAILAFAFYFFGCNGYHSHRLASHGSISGSEAFGLATTQPELICQLRRT